MKIKNNSSFSQGEVCGTGRKFASYVLDFLTSAILMVLIFTISESIMNSTAMMKEYREDIMTSYSSLITMIEESGISEADEKPSRFFRFTAELYEGGCPSFFESK